MDGSARTVADPAPANPGISNSRSSAGATSSVGSSSGDALGSKWGSNGGSGADAGGHASSLRLANERSSDSIDMQFVTLAQNAWRGHIDAEKVAVVVVGSCRGLSRVSGFSGGGGRPP
jgi:hypothetical protein